MITYKPARERTPDTQYQDLLRRILTTGRRIHPIHGRLHSAPEGDAIMVLGAQMRHE